jgi:hypothetical protein
MSLSAVLVKLCSILLVPFWRGVRGLVDVPDGTDPVPYGTDHVADYRACHRLYGVTKHDLSFLI